MNTTSNDFSSFELKVYNICNITYMIDNNIMNYLVTYELYMYKMQKTSSIIITKPKHAMLVRINYIGEAWCAVIVIIFTLART